MKLRIRDNSIRLRLSRGEVDTFGELGVVEAAIEFPGQTSLSYALERGEGDNIGASYSDGRIVITVPSAESSDWVATDRVGMSGEVAIDGGTLSILIEKDFQCLTARSGEDEADMYPHPGACTGHGHGAKSESC